MRLLANRSDKTPNHTVFRVDLLHNEHLRKDSGKEKDGSNAKAYAERDVDRIPITIRVSEVWLNT